MSVESTGVLLKTSLLAAPRDTTADGGCGDYLSSQPSRNEVILNRTLLYNGALHEQQTVRPYVPPLFLLIICERSPFKRYLYNDRHPPRHRDYQYEGGRYVDDDLEPSAPVAEDAPVGVNTTDAASKENELITMELLKVAGCLPDKFEHSFLRLEHAGSLQSEIIESFPVPALRIGRLARLTFVSVRKRNRALDVLHENVVANADVYAINYSSNACMTTVTRYLEPLFRHAMRLQKAWCAEEKELGEEGEKDCDDGVFDVNFHVFDTRTTADEQDRQTAAGSFFVVGSTSRPVENTAESRARTTIRERVGRASPLTVHDVSRFYAHQPFYGDRDGAAKLQTLAVVQVRHERDFFCLSGCTEYGGRLAVLHVYYTWNPRAAENLGRLRPSSSTTSSNTSADSGAVVESVRVCDTFGSQAAAYVRMLDDAEACFWKRNQDCYVRLVLDSKRDITTYSRFVLHDLLTMDTSGDKVSLQCKIEGHRKTTDGGRIEVFPNSIALDCSKLVEDLIDDSAFAIAYKRCTKSGMFYASADGAEDVPITVLSARQQRVTDLLSRFKSERIAEMCYSAANELYLGVLDLYGVRSGDGDNNNNNNNNYNSLPKHDSVSNYAFVRALVKESIYTGSTCFHTDLSETMRNTSSATVAGAVGDDTNKSIPVPVASFNEGVFFTHESKEIVEFDMESAYPALIDAFNVSQETTAIVCKTDFDEAEKWLKSKSGQFELSRWYFVTPYENAAEQLVIVSVSPSVYKGVTCAALRSLILNRRTGKKIMERFYKRLANRLCGCTAQTGNDLYALHCYAAAASLCKSAVAGTLDGLKHSVRVLRAQTDGGLVQATTGGSAVPLGETVRAAFADAVYRLHGARPHEGGAVTKNMDSLLNLRIRRVNVCFIAGQNRYAVRYADDGTVALRGHPSKCVPNATAAAAVSDALMRTIDDVITDGGQYEYEAMLSIFFDHLEYHRVYGKRTRETEEEDDSYFMEYTVPSEEENRWHGGEKERAAEEYDRHCRFGDTVALWAIPTTLDGENKCMWARVRRPAQRYAAVNRLFCMKNLIKFWTHELCRVKCYDFNDKTAFARMFAMKFFSACRREQSVESTSG